MPDERFLLRDLCSRIKTKYICLPDFKYEYQLMCKRLKQELLVDFESRIQFIQFELDDIVEDLFAEDNDEEEEEEGAQDEPESVPEPETAPVPELKVLNDVKNIKVEKTDDHMTIIHTDLNFEEEEQVVTNGGEEVHLTCQYCDMKFNEAGVYSCKRNHRVCSNCRLVNTGCICPVCYSQHGDRKRLALDHAANIFLRYSCKYVYIVSDMGVSTSQVTL